MSATTDTQRRSLRLNTIFLKATAIVAVVAALVVATISYFSYENSVTLVKSRLAVSGGTLTELTGQRVGGAMKFNKPELAAEIAEDVNRTTQGEVVEILLLSLDGQIFYHFLAPGIASNETEMKGFAAPLLAQIAALPADGKLQHSDELIIAEDRLNFAHPAHFGADADNVGVIVMRYDPSSLMASITEKIGRMLAIGGVVFVVALICASFLFRHIVSHPLTRLTQAVQQVANGAYDTTIPGSTSGDEAGDIARAIEGFRVDLAASVETTRVGMFKGSGFEGASAALIVTDTEFRVQFLNPAAKALIAAHFPQLAAQSRIEGALVLEMDPALRVLPGLVQKTLPGRIGFSRGKDMLDLAFNAVTDDKGKQSGYVLEWRTTTQSRRNAAVLSAMDATQLRGEFLPNGDLEEVNGRLATALGLTSAALGGNRHSLRDLLGFLDPTQGSLWDRISAGKPINGLLRLALKDGKHTLIAAQINPLLDDEGQLRSYLLVGSDVTREQQLIAEAEALRKTQQAEQAKVVNGLRDALSNLSDGELTIRITEAFPADYESLRHDFNTAAERLSLAINEVSHNSIAIRGEVGDISAAAEQLSRRTEQQAATLEQTAAALDTMTTSVKVSAEVASNANARAIQARSSADSSGKVVREAVAAMSDIEESSSKISRITSVIDEIAFQTNLLALNAGVEAARAGEAGRGFAVVATEVRELAQRSSAAAREIASLISASSDQVKRGVSLVGEAGLSLQGIEKSVEEIHGLVEEIANSAKEQSNGISELNTAVQHLDQVTQQNAAMFEETAAASQSLNRMADALSQATQHFKLEATGATPRKQEPRIGTASAWGKPAVSTPNKPAAPLTFKASARAERAAPATHGRTALALQGDPAGWEEF